MTPVCHKEQRNRHQKRRFVGGNKERGNKEGDCNSHTMPEHFFHRAYRNQGSFWKLKKKKKKSWQALTDTDTKQMSDIKHCTVKSVGRNTRTYKQFIHQFAVIRPQSNGSNPSSWSWLFLSHYIYQPLRAPCAEKADFFPQKLDSSCLTPPSPPPTLFNHFRLSASQL